MGIKCDDICPNCKFADFTNDRCTFDNASYEQGRADRDKEIAEHNVFFSNKPIEDIVLDARADERAKMLDELLGLKPQIYAWLIKREKGGYGTTLGECTDKIFEEIEKVFKSHK